MVSGRRRSGFALMAVLVALGLLGVAAIRLVDDTRGAIGATAALDRGARARWVARGGAALALDGLHVAVAVSPSARRLATEGDTVLPTIEQEEGGIALRVRTLDARGRVALNHATALTLARLGEALGDPPGDAERTATAIVRRRELLRARGGPLTPATASGRDPRAPSPLARARAGIAADARPRTSAIDEAFGEAFGDVADLHGVPGVDARSIASWGPWLSAAGDGRVNVNSAPAPVLRTLPGVDARGAERLLGRRARAPFRNLYELIDALPEPARSRARAAPHDLAALVAFEPRWLVLESLATPTAGGAGGVVRSIVLLGGGSLVSVVRTVER